MPLEIERKFILKNNPIETDNHAVLFIQQGYKEVDGEIVRLRKTRKKHGRKASFILCRKTLVGHGTYEEVEEESDERTFNDWVHDNTVKWVKKKRFILEVNGLKWEVDEYFGIVLITLEVELMDINQDINIPEEIENQIIMEVTGRQEMTNYNLSEYGVPNFF